MFIKRPGRIAFLGRTIPKQPINPTRAKLDMIRSMTKGTVTLRVIKIDSPEQERLGSQLCFSK
jgi:hypothetical protein